MIRKPDKDTVGSESRSDGSGGSAAISLERRIRMLRTAMGPEIAAALEDPEVRDRDRKFNRMSPSIARFWSYRSCLAR